MSPRQCIRNGQGLEERCFRLLHSSVPQVPLAETAVSIGQFRLILGDFRVLPRQGIPERRCCLDLPFGLGPAFFSRKNGAQLSMRLGQGITIGRLRGMVRHQSAQDL
jgi:hypothetical protein